jgi:hypothetical protein
MAVHERRLHRARRAAAERVALIWTDIDGAVSHTHPCYAELVSCIVECPTNVTTGCNVAVAVWRCKTHRSIVGIVDGAGRTHRHSTAAK